MSSPPIHLAALVTPFEPRTLDIDFPWMTRHLRFLEERGADGVLVLGTTGEFPSLSHREKLGLIDHVLRHRGGLEVLVGANATSIDEVRSLIRRASRRGADGVLVIPPYYYKQVSGDGLHAFYRSVLEDSPLPAYLYNIPQLSGVEISRELIERLGSFESLRGVKDSTGTTESLAQFCALPDFVVFVGNDDLLLKGLEMGARGSITAVGNAFPDRSRAVIDASDASDREAAQAGLGEARRLFDAIPGPATMKYLLEQLGFPPTAVRPPLRELDEVERSRLALGFNTLAGL